jgi:hypothetical protein
MLIPGAEDDFALIDKRPGFDKTAQAVESPDELAGGQVEGAECALT